MALFGAATEIAPLLLGGAAAGTLGCSPLLVRGRARRRPVSDAVVARPAVAFAFGLAFVLGGAEVGAWCSRSVSASLVLGAGSLLAERSTA